MSYLRLIFSILAAGLLIGGPASTVLAEEEQVAEGDQVAEEEQASETAVTASVPSYALVWNGPRSLDTLIDERRDAMRDRRGAFHDNLRMLYGIHSPWMDYERSAWRAYSDQMRDMYRAHRDAMKFHHDLRRSYFMPWSRPFTEAAEARRFALAMENLDRQELMDELRYAYQPVFGGPVPW
jgi:hypothetical protein